MNLSTTERKIPTYFGNQGHSRKLLFTLLSIAILFSTFSFRDFRSDEKDFGHILQMEETTLQEIFTLEKGADYTLVLINEANKIIEMKASVATHLNKGDKSGVMRLDLNYNGLKFKLLLSRKELSGKLQYQVNMMQEGGSINYRLLRIDSKGVSLEKTSLSKIVTE
jgi:hypothetical protein